MTTRTKATEIKGQIEELQKWFAAKPYGWREHATPDQLRQWDAREQEQDRLNDELETLNG